MALFSKRTRTKQKSPVRTTGTRVATHTGGLGYAPDLESELFLMAATNMATQSTYHEHARDRDRRFVDLVHRVTQSNPDFVRRFAPYLRNELKIRSASVVLAAEYVAAGGEGGRQVVDSVLQRGDEPAEMLGYWLGTHGRQIKMAVKRGIADAATRLYTERNVLKYDGKARAVRMADVIELTHPKPRDAKQSALFKWLLDQRHHGDAVADAELLPKLAADAASKAVAVEDRRAAFREGGAKALADAGASWERVAGWLPGGMDAEAWETVIDQMGVMALIRNLRNFDEKGISDAAIAKVLDKITDPDHVAKSRIFPYQVWAAYKHAPSDTWKRALGFTLDHATTNVPRLDRTLVAIDMSGSMQSKVSAKSTMSRVEVAAVMAAVTAQRSTDATVVIFGATNKRVKVRRGASTLGVVNDLVGMIGDVGHATYGHTAIARHFDARWHDRVVLFTDDQMHDAGKVDLRHVPVIYTVDLAGYRPRSLPSGDAGRYTLAGFSDVSFTLMKTLEDGRNGEWPF